MNSLSDVKYANDIAIKRSAFLVYVDLQELKNNEKLTHNDFETYVSLISKVRPIKVD